MSFDLPRCGRQVSWLAAAGCLVGVLALAGPVAPAAAQQAQPTTDPTNQPGELQKLVQELSDQFWYAFRYNVPEHRLRHEQLREAITAWNASSQNAADRQTMVAWLRGAMQASMPGTLQPLPALPEFGKPAADNTVAAPTAVTTSTTAAATPPPSPAPAAATQTNTSYKPVVPDAPTAAGNQTKAPQSAAAGDDFWFSKSGEDAAVQSGTKNSGDFWSEYPQGAPSQDSTAPAESNPFGDDPQSP
jgi:hypothetical protein